VTLQRYVSEELTHFVGRGKSEEEQYSVLVESILKSGWLKYYPVNPTPAEVLPSGSFVHGRHPGAPVDEMFTPYRVCFCDIPVTDLEIHMRKYSRFGLSFLKPYLIGKGANPVLYVARNSGALSMGMPEEIAPTHGKGHPREVVFEQNLNQYISLARRLMESDDSSPFAERGPGHLSEEQRAFMRLQFFLDVNVFSFIKYFDDSTSDEDPANVYMEREWRVLGDVNFDLKDVYRVFLPQMYGARFREDLPEYAGQVTFVEAGP
jgi:hypothetical protein